MGKSIPAWFEKIMVLFTGFITWGALLGIGESIFESIPQGQTNLEGWEPLIGLVGGIFSLYLVIFILLPKPIPRETITTPLDRTS
jgi:hypothetical protein